MLVRTASGRGVQKSRSTMIQLPEALAGYPVAIDPHSGPPHDLWFSHRRIGFLTLDGPRPVVDVDPPSLVALNELHPKNPNQPALQTSKPSSTELNHRHTNLMPHTALHTTCPRTKL